MLPPDGSSKVHADGDTVLGQVSALEIGFVQEDVFDCHYEHLRDLEREFERRRVLVAFNRVYAKDHRGREKSESP